MRYVHCASATFSLRAAPPFLEIASLFSAACSVPAAHTHKHNYTHTHTDTTTTQWRSVVARPRVTTHPRVASTPRGSVRRQKRKAAEINNLFGASRRIATPHTHTHSCKDQSQEWGSSGGPGAAPAALTFRAGEVRGRAGRRCPRSRRQKTRRGPRVRPNTAKQIIIYVLPGGGGRLHQGVRPNDAGSGPPPHR